MSGRDIREILAQELITTAAWRRKVAAGDRGTGALDQASGLEQVAQRIRSLAADDPRLQRLAAANRDPEFFALGGEEIRSVIDQFGSTGLALPVTEESCSAFIESLLEATRSDDAAIADDVAPPLVTDVHGEPDTPV